MYDVIYLIPDDNGTGYVWCQDPAPGIEMKEEDAIKYIRADLVDKRQAQQAKTKQTVGTESVTQPVIKFCQSCGTPVGMDRD